jgi:hypothetical protein
VTSKRFNLAAVDWTALCVYATLALTAIGCIWGACCPEAR